jgi:hypothetical protein
MKMRLFGKGERQSSGKDLERKPLTVWILGREPCEDIRFWASDDSPNLQDLRSKALELYCLSLKTFHCDTVSSGKGESFEG